MSEVKERVERVARPAIVVNCKTGQYDALIDRTTIFGNPFKVGQYGREGCIKKFETYFYRRIERDPEWRTQILAQLGGGKRLGCHCKPLDCHGDIYADWLNAQEWITKIKEGS